MALNERVSVSVCVCSVKGRVEEKGLRACKNLQDARRKSALTNSDYFIIYIKLKKGGSS